MDKQWGYFLAVFFLLIVRVGVLNTNYGEILGSLGYTDTSAFILLLKNSVVFNQFMGSWALPVFVVTVLAYWAFHRDEGLIPMQFLILPIAYVPFSIVGEILSTAEAHLSYIWVHPLVILPFGYFYVSFWTIFIWLLEKLRIVS